MMRMTDPWWLGDPCVSGAWNALPWSRNRGFILSILGCLTLSPMFDVNHKIKLEQNFRSMKWWKYSHNLPHISAALWPMTDIYTGSEVHPLSTEIYIIAAVSTIVRPIDFSSFFFRFQKCFLDHPNKNVLKLPSRQGQTERLWDMKLSVWRSVVYYHWVKWAAQ